MLGGIEKCDGTEFICFVSADDLYQYIDARFCWHWHTEHRELENECIATYDSSTIGHMRRANENRILDYFQFACDTICWIHKLLPLTSEKWHRISSDCLLCTHTWRHLWDKLCVRHLAFRKLSTYIYKMLLPRELLFATGFILPAPSMAQRKFVLFIFFYDAMCQRGI